MFYIALYFIVSYFVAFSIVIPVLLSAKREEVETTKGAARWRNSRRRKIFALMVLLLPLAPYAGVETQTLIFKSILLAPARQAALEDMGSNHLVSLKVLSFTPWSATVYAVVPCCSVSCTDLKGYSGIVYSLRRGRHGWAPYGDSDGIWSDCGNADGDIFPPYPADGDYH